MQGNLSPAKDASGITSGQGKKMEASKGEPLTNESGRVPSRDKPDYFAGVLSALVPGLGQLFQGRAFKGWLFLGCVYFLFFYGWILGGRSNVYLPRAEQCVPFKTNIVRVAFGIPFPKPLYYRWQYVGQVGVGIAAWPAIIQCYWADEENEPDVTPPLLGKYLKAPPERELNRLQTEGDASWELAWVFTVAAGLLNLLGIYDALCGPAVIPDKKSQGTDSLPLAKGAN
ncbi:MAG: DUF6677 family protein [Gemmataceae bacterium]